MQQKAPTNYCLLFADRYRDYPREYPPRGGLLILCFSKVIHR